MDIQVITQAISTVGFPIAVSCALLYLLNKNNEEHKEEVNSLKDAINNNTQVLSRILEHFNDIK